MSKNKAKLIRWLTETGRQNKCSVCYTDANIHWHHTDPKNKVMTCSRALRTNKKVWLVEVAKCVPLCAECHKAEHKRMRGATHG